MIDGFKNREVICDAAYYALDIMPDYYRLDYDNYGYVEVECPINYDREFGRQLYGIRHTDHEQSYFNLLEEFEELIRYENELD